MSKQFTKKINQTGRKLLKPETQCGAWKRRSFAAGQNRHIIYSRLFR